LSVQTIVLSDATDYKRDSLQGQMSITPNYTKNQLIFKWNFSLVPGSS